jgi:hypothetical protein
MAAGYKTGGRKAGTPNKSTERVREAIAQFADGNVHRLEGWLDQIAEDDPKGAAMLFVKLLEYHVPKMSSVEHDIGEQTMSRLIINE